MFEPERMVIVHKDEEGKVDFRDSIAVEEWPDHPEEQQAIMEERYQAVQEAIEEAQEG